MTRAFAHSFPPSLSLPYIQTGGIFWQTFSTEKTEGPACTFRSPTTALFPSRTPPTLIPKATQLPPFFESRKVWDEGAGGEPTPGLTELAKARVLGHVTHGTFA